MRGFEKVVFSITYDCNSKCETCFFWKEVNQGKKVLSMAEIRKVSDKMSMFNLLVLSGGEPTLKKEIVDIVQLFHENNGVKEVQFATNCLLPDRIRDVIRNILHRCPQLKLRVCLSLDGVGKVHDTTRGVVGNFDRVVELERKLKYLQNPNLSVRVRTTITPNNYGNMEALMLFVRQNMNVSGHDLEFARGNTRDERMKEFSVGQVVSLNRKVLENSMFYYPNLLHKFYERHNLKHHMKLLERFYRTKKLSRQCVAGKDFIIILPDGDVCVCESTLPMGNLRDYNYDINTLLASADNTIFGCDCPQGVVSKSFLERLKVFFYGS